MFGKFKNSVYEIIKPDFFRIVKREQIMKIS